MEDEELETCCGSGCNNWLITSYIFIAHHLINKHLFRSVLDVKKVNKDESKELQKISGRYQNFILTKIDKTLFNTFRYNFRLKDADRGTLDIPAGNYLMVRAPKDFVVTSNSIYEEFQKLESETKYEHQQKPPLDKHDKETEDKYISRKYTPIELHEDSSFDVLIKLEFHGEMAKYFQSLRIGDETEWKGSYGDFYYKLNSFKNLLLFSHGVSITSFYRLITIILKDDQETTKINLISCYRDLSSILFRNEIHELGQYWNFKSNVYLSRKDSNCLKSRLRYNEKVSNHRLDIVELEKLTELCKIDPKTTLALISGREAFINSVINDLLELKFENIKVL